MCMIVTEKVVVLVCGFNFPADGSLTGVQSV